MDPKDALMFDTIVIDQGRGRRKLSVAEFLELPLGERVGLILGRKLEFWDGNQGVDQKAALRNLMNSISKAPGGKR